MWENDVNIHEVREIRTRTSVFFGCGAINKIEDIAKDFKSKGLDKDIARKIKFTVAPKTCEDGKSILLVNIRNLSFDEIFNTLMNLFYFIKETAEKYKNK